MTETETVDAEIVPAETAPAVQGFSRRSFEALKNTPIDTTEGRALVLKEHLENVPHIITGFVMREGASETGYSSVEAVTENDTDIVYNDSGTGIRDQLEDYLVAKGMIRRSSRRIPWEDWEILDTVRITRSVSKKGKTSLHVTDVALYVRNGLRRSDYEWSNGKQSGDGTTFYLN